MKHSQHESRGVGDFVARCTSCGFDAFVALVYLVVIDAAILSNQIPQVLRAVIALPLLVFLPGYAITAALFPRRVDHFRTDRHHSPFSGATTGALTPGERVTLSFGTSLAVLPVLGVVHSVTALGFETTALLGTLSVVIVAGLGIGVVRRVRAPHRDRVSFAPSTWPAAVKSHIVHQSRLDTALTLALVVAVLAATSGLSLALVAPNDGESYTTVKLLTENDDGDLVTDGYPEEVAVGDSASLVLGVENHEGAQTTYTVVTELQRVQEGDGTTTVAEDRELGRSTQTVAAGETWYDEQTVSPEQAGENQRLVFLLYRGEAADDPQTANAYRYVHISIDVTEG